MLHLRNQVDALEYYNTRVLVIGDFPGFDSWGLSTVELRGVSEFVLHESSVNELNNPCQVIRRRSCGVVRKLRH